MKSKNKKQKKKKSSCVISLPAVTIRMSLSFYVSRNRQFLLPPLLQVVIYNYILIQSEQNLLAALSDLGG